ncbi:MAG: DUF3179 domain-containing protein [Chloroflexi bacterium]|nr:DUF3179 domain-containing protein [Chloroflexota bacterium]
MDQRQSIGHRFNAWRRAWDESLNPRGRALIFVGIIALAVVALLSAGGGVSKGGVFLSVYIAAIVTLLLARRGYFADRVTVILDRGGESVEARLQIRPILKRDRVRPLYETASMTAEEASAVYPPHTRVLGIVHEGDVRAYPLAVLSYRESIHDTVGGVPLLVTWAPFCYTGRVFLAPSRSGTPAGGTYTGDAPFRVGSTGRVVVNSPVLYELETGAQWLQYQGAALDGPDIGARLSEIPSLNTTLAAWMDAYPDTRVLDDRVAPLGDLFDRYYSSGRAGMHRAPHRDPRWPPKEIVSGVSINGDVCAFPMSWLQIEPVVNEEVGGVPLVVAYEEHSASVLVFRAEIGGRRLTFEADEDEQYEEDEQDEQLEESENDSPAGASVVESDDPSDNDWVEQEEPDYEPMMLRDLETGSWWHATNGTCVEGELAGESLEPVVAGLSFWFAWTNFHPSTRLPPRPDLSGLAPAADEGE